MKTIVLSDFVGDQLSEHDRKREAWNDAMGEFWRKENAGSIRRMRALEASAKKAFASHRFVWGSFLYLVGVVYSFCAALLMVPRAYDHGTNLPSQAVAVLRSGNDGEQRVKNKMSALPDEFTLLQGYKNHKGKIDQVLVGPHGIVCLEIKNVNGKISCNGDRWWRDNFDAYGNLLEKNVLI